MSGARLYLVTYDVASRRRWRRVFKLLSRAGAWAQYSAFFCRLTPERAAALERSLRGVLSAQEDRLLVVDLGPAGHAGGRIAALGGLTLPGPPEAVIL